MSDAALGYSQAHEHDLHACHEVESWALDLAKICSARSLKAAFEMKDCNEIRTRIKAARTYFDTMFRGEADMEKAVYTTEVKVRADAEAEKKKMEETVEQMQKEIAKLQSTAKWQQRRLEEEVEKNKKMKEAAKA